MLYYKNMKPLKFRFKSISNIQTAITKSYGYFTLQSVLYDSTNLDSQLMLFDKDGDMFFHKIPGNAYPRPITDHPITVELPIYYMDTDPDGDNLVVIWGEHSLPERIDSGL